MKYKIKKRSMQNNELIVKEEGVAYITNSKNATSKFLDKLSYAEYVEQALDESDKEFESPETITYDWSDVFQQMRRKINGKKV